MVVVTILALLATVAITAIEPAADQARFDATTRVLSSLDEALLGTDGLKQVDGTPLISGFVADMGRTPVLQGSAINWTFFSPAGFFAPGERTGKFRVGTTELIVDAQGQSRISMEDYAIALVDELETPRHERTQMTAAY